MSKYGSWNINGGDYEVVVSVDMFGPFWAPPYPAGTGEPMPDTKRSTPEPAKCSKCQEPFPYEAHESGKCYRCRGGK